MTVHSFTFQDYYLNSVVGLQLTFSW